MKQFYVVNSAAALNGGAASPKDLSGMVAGSIGFYALDNPNAWLSAKAEKILLLYMVVVLNLLLLYFLK